MRRVGVIGDWLFDFVCGFLVIIGLLLWFGYHEFKDPSGMKEWVIDVAVCVTLSTAAGLVVAYLLWG